MTFRRVRATPAFLTAFVIIASGSKATYAARDILVGGGKAIVRIDAPKIKVEKMSQSQYRITLPTSAKGQWLGTRQKTLMVGTLTARDLVDGWTASYLRPATTRRNDISFCISLRGNSSPSADSPTCTEGWQRLGCRYVEAIPADSDHRPETVSSTMSTSIGACDLMASPWVRPISNARS